MQHSKVSTVALDAGWEVEIYREWAFPSHVVERWHLLACEYGDAGVFLGPGWFETWWESFGEAGKLLVLVLKQDGEIQGLLPCRLPFASEEQLKPGLYSLTNDHTCHYDVLVSRKHAREALQHFLGAMEEVCHGRQACFEYVPVNSENGRACIRSAQDSWAAVHVTQEPWAPSLDLPHEWECFVETLPGRLRNTLKRCRKKAEAIGTVELEVIRHSDQLDKRLDELFAIEAHSWKGQEGTAMKCDPIVEGFYRRLAHWAMGQRALWLFFLKLNGRPIAASFCLSSGSTVYLVKPGFDQSYSNLSPGTLLQADVLKHLRTMPGIYRYDFLGACDAWKLEWTSRVSQNGTLQVYPRTVQGWVAYVVQHGWKDPLKQVGIVQALKDLVGTGGGRTHAK